MNEAICTSSDGFGSHAVILDQYILIGYIRHSALLYSSIDNEDMSSIHSLIRSWGYTFYQRASYVIVYVFDTKPGSDLSLFDAAASSHFLITAIGKVNLLPCAIKPALLFLRHFHIVFYKNDVVSVRKGTTT